MIVSTFSSTLRLLKGCIVLSTTQTRSIARSGAYGSWRSNIITTGLYTQMKHTSTQTPSSTHAFKGLLKRKCFDGNCHKCSNKLHQRSSSESSELSTVPPIVHKVLRSPGQPLDPVTRAYLKPRFDHGFSHALRRCV